METTPPRAAEAIEPLLISISEACRIAGVSRSELYRRLAAGQIAAKKLGVRTRVVLSSLRQHVAALPAASFRQLPKATNPFGE